MFVNVSTEAPKTRSRVVWRWMFIEAWTHNAHCECSQMASTAWWNYKQKQSKPKLSISSSSKLRNAILELPMNSQSIYKMHRWTQELIKWPVATWRQATPYARKNISHFMILRTSSMNNCDLEMAAHNLMPMASRHTFVQIRVTEHLQPQPGINKILLHEFKQRLINEPTD